MSEDNKQPFRYLSDVEFNALTRAEKNEYLTLALLELERRNAALNRLHGGDAPIPPVETGELEAEAHRAIVALSARDRD